MDQDRRQDYLLPSSLDDYVTENNTLRVIKAFIDEFYLVAVGFAGVSPMYTGGGGASQHRSAMLKIYFYGYLTDSLRASAWSMKPSAMMQLLIIAFEAVRPSEYVQPLGRAARFIRPSCATKRMNQMSGQYCRHSAIRHGILLPIYQKAGAEKGVLTPSTQPVAFVTVLDYRQKLATMIRQQSATGPQPIVVTRCVTCSVFTKDATGGAGEDCGQEGAASER